MKKIITINRLLLIIAIICLYFSIRWSDLPAPSIQIIEYFFVHNENVDSSLLNVATGYLTGYFVYLLTVVFPNYSRKRPIQKLVYQKLSAIINQSCYLLLLMCKNCSSPEEYASVIGETDIASFNKKFYELMERFDITSAADTLLLHRDSREKMLWYEYLKERYEEMLKDANNIYLVYHSYLDDTDLRLLEQLINSSYLDMFDGGKAFNQEFCDKNHFYYLEPIPVTIVYAGNPNLSHIFRNVNGRTNPILEDYVTMLEEISKFLQNKVSQFDPCFSISRLTKKNFGKYKTQTETVSKAEIPSASLDNNVNSQVKTVPVLQIPVYSKEEMTQIQADAYYIALKRLKDEEKQEQELLNKKKEPLKRFSKEWWIDCFFTLLILVFPFKTPKHFSTNKYGARAYILVITSLILMLLGTAMYIAGAVSIAYGIFTLFKVHQLSNYLTFGILILLFGDLTLFAGNSATLIEEESNIYAFSASIFAMLSMIIGVIAIIVSKYN